MGNWTTERDAELRAHLETVGPDEHGPVVARWDDLRDLLAELDRIAALRVPRG